MSIEGAAAPAAGDRDPRRQIIGTAHARFALRLTFGASLAFTVSELLSWPLSLLPAVLTIQALVLIPGCPPIRTGLGSVLMVALCVLIALATSHALITFPDLLLGAIGLALFVAFYMDARGRSGFLVYILLVTMTVIPIAALQSAAVAREFAGCLVLAIILAILTAWTAHAVFPAPTLRSRPTRPQIPTAAAPSWLARVALVKTAIVLPVEMVLLLFELTDAIVVLVITITIVRQHDTAAGYRSSLGLLVGNLIGGIAAIIAYNLTIAVPSLLGVFLLLFLVGLLFAERIAAAGPKAPIFVVAYTTMFVIYGSSIAPLSEEAATIVYIRLAYVFIAAAYSVGMLAVAEAVWPAAGAQGSASS